MPLTSNDPMFILAVLALALAGAAVHALLLVLVSRLLLRSSLTLGSAFKAVFLALAVSLLVIVAFLLAGIRLVMFRNPNAEMFWEFGPLVLAAVLLAWLGKTANGETIGMRKAAIATVLVSLVSFVGGWAVWNTYKPAYLASPRASRQEGQLGVLSEICLRNLALMVSDTGSGPRPDAAAEFKKRLEQDVRAKGITMEEALKQEVRKLGGMPPRGCDHLK